MDNILYVHCVHLFFMCGPYQTCQKKESIYTAVLKKYIINHVKATGSSRWDWSGLPYLVQLLTWLQVSECRNFFWITERW